MRTLSFRERGRTFHARPSGLATIVSAVLLMAAAITPALAASPAQWHRNNYNEGHERLTCREATPSWTCFYESDVSDPEATAFFGGRNVTANWTCPEWFPGTICDNVTEVYQGTTVYHSGRASDPVRQYYVLTEVAGQEVLQLYWVDQFVCPWYRTFEEALAADFNCVFAPA